MLATNCQTKQIQNVQYAWFREVFDDVKWQDMFAGDRGCTSTQNIGWDKFCKYKPWLKRVTAFLVCAEATYEQAEAHFSKKIKGEWYYGCRSDLTAILTVSWNAAQCVAEAKYRLKTGGKVMKCSHCDNHTYVELSTDNIETGVVKWTCDHDECKKSQCTAIEIKSSLTPHEADMAKIVAIKQHNSKNRMAKFLEQMMKAAA